MLHPQLHIRLDNVAGHILRHIRFKQARLRDVVLDEGRVERREPKLRVAQVAVDVCNMARESGIVLGIGSVQNEESRSKRESSELGKLMFSAMDRLRL